MKIFKKFIAFIKTKNNIFLSKIQKRRREKFFRGGVKEKLINKNFSLIANNCNGCILLHEFGLRFNSQFVNLYLDASDYIKYLKNFDYYNSIDLVFNKELSKNHPVGNLDDLIIHFVHYKSFEEAKNKWNERKKRINKDNLFVIFTEQSGCTKQNLIDFDNLSFKNKVVFTCKRYKDIKNSIFVKRYYGSEEGVYMFYEYVNKYSKRRKYDIFDWVSWFNGETDLKKLDKQKKGNK